MSDMEKEKITLLACPFCGGEAEIVQDWIRCIKCGVWTDVPKEEDGLPKSIQAWNTRAKQVDERIVLDVDAVYREILNVQEEIESEHKDISLLASQRRRMAVRIVNTFKPKVEVTEEDMKVAFKNVKLENNDRTQFQGLRIYAKAAIQLLKDKGIL